MRKKIILSIIVNILLILFFLWSNFTKAPDEQYVMIHLVYIILFAWIFCIISGIVCGFKMYGIYMLYLISYLIFIFGQIISRYMFMFTDEMISYLFKIISDEDLTHGVVLAIYCMLSLHLGALICKLVCIKNTYICKVSQLNKYKLMNMKKVASLIFLITFPFACFNLVSTLKLSISGGYNKTYSNITYGASSIGEKIVPFFFISLLMLIVAYREELKVAKSIFWFTIFYTGVQILFGARGIPLLQIIVTIILWHSMVSRINKMTVIKIILCLIPLSSFLSIMKEIRSYPLGTWFNNFNVIFLESLRNNPILSVINEMGTAIYPTSAALLCSPNMIPFQKGKTFLYAFFTIIPNLGSGEHWTKQYTDITNIAASYFNAPFGGSIVEEGYINFGWASILFFIAIGFCLVKLEIYVENNKERIEYLYPLYAALSVEILWSIRNNLAPVIIYSTRYILLTYILYKIVCKVFGKKGIKKENNL